MGMGTESVGDVLMRAILEIGRKSIAMSITVGAGEGDMFMVSAMLSADDTVTESCVLTNDPEQLDQDEDAIAQVIFKVLEDANAHWRRKQSLGKVSNAKDAIACPNGPRCFERVYRSRLDAASDGADRCYACRKTWDQATAGGLALECTNVNAKASRDRTQRMMHDVLDRLARTQQRRDDEEEQF